MTKEELAALLNGREIDNEITREEERAATMYGLVVIFGASDDLMEFRGAIHDEEYPGRSGVVKVHRKGVLPSHNDCDCAYCGYDAMAAKCATVTAVWGDLPTGPMEGYSWTYKTDLPHATFDIMEDGEKYCRGIVLDSSALPAL